MVLLGNCVIKLGNIYGFSEKRKLYIPKVYDYTLEVDNYVNKKRKGCFKVINECF